MEQGHARALAAAGKLPTAATRNTSAAPGSKPMPALNFQRRLSAPERKSRELSKPQRAVSRLRCRTWFPRSGISMHPSGFPPRAGLHTGRRDQRPLYVLVRLAPKRKSRELQGKCQLKGATSLLPSLPCLIRNPLSVREARPGAAASHSAFSSTATNHRPDQGPET